MFRAIMTIFLGLSCFAGGVAVGILFGPELRATELGRKLDSVSQTLPLRGLSASADKDSPIENYDYPRIKWRARPLAEPEGAIGQLLTKYECTDEKQKLGKILYKLTLFKALDKQKCRVQILDEQGFKVIEFDATDFRKMPGAADITEANDSSPCNEADYKKAADYSIN